jgi:hypothetical protein
MRMWGVKVPRVSTRHQVYPYTQCYAREILRANSVHPEAERRRQWWSRRNFSNFAGLTC